jgi:hypothetical protein
MARKTTKAEVRAEIRRELEDWPAHRARMEAMHEHWRARMRAAGERERRRQARLRRLTFGLLGR